jgi:glycosyltransferase involved in cell wall biosynthesis
MISVLIPAFNESERIAATLAALRELPLDTEIIVVDDGSQDDTARIADEAGATLVLRQENQGKGAALQRALHFATGDILLLLDADLGDSAREATKLLEPVLSSAADMTIATFPVIPGKGGGRGFVVRKARQGILSLAGRTMEAPLSGQRALRREIIEKCGGFAAGWGAEVALTVRALWWGYRVLEVPTEMTHRVTGKDMASVLHRWRQYKSVARTLRKLEEEMPESPPPARGGAAGHG